MPEPASKEIEVVIGLLKKYLKRYEDPYVTQEAERSRDPFRVLISCLLSLRTRDKTTEKASERLFRLADTPKKMANIDTKIIEKAIYPVGFYKTKAKRIKEICKELIEKYNGKVPDNFDELMKFKGVGRKTANIVMVYGFNKECLPIDVHCNRIPNRLGWIKTKTPEQTEYALMNIMPNKYWQDFNNLFVTFGQNICLPARPKCYICPVEKHCRYEKKNLKRPEKL